MVLCGLALESLDFKVPISAVTASPGDKVRLVIGSPPHSSASLPGALWWEPIWAVVKSVGSTGDILTAAVLTAPEKTTELKKNNHISFTRDCVIQVQPF